MGVDSHSVICGALNAAGTGIGGEEAAYALAFGELWFQAPESVRIRLSGRARNCPLSKDFVLTLAGRHGDGFAQYRAIEYSGPLVADLSIASRMCPACHGVEAGAKFAFFLADARAQAYLRAGTGSTFEPVCADPDAEYVREIELDVDEVGFVVALPQSQARS